MPQSLNPNAKTPEKDKTLSAKNKPATEHKSAVQAAVPAAASPAAGEPRRGMLFKILSVAIGAVISLGPFGAGLTAFLDPLWRKKKVPEKYRKPGGAGSDKFVRVTSLDSLAIGGTPQRFPVIDDKIDAWNFTPAQPIGAVFIQRVAPHKVVVLNATCPHAGCSVACNGTAFNCPCHNSAFNLDGSRRENESGRENPSPRALDSLVVDDDRLQQGEVWIEFMNFYTGVEEKKPKA